MAMTSRRRATSSILWILALWLTVLSPLMVSSVVLAQELNISAKAAILMEYSSGDILYEKNSDSPLPMASVTKIMPLVIALEQLRDGKLSWDDIVTTSEYAKSMGGSQIWLETGEQMTVRELLYAIAVGSANDASVAIAEFIGGSEPAFVDMMNKKAAELGMKNTVFSNPSGLPSEIIGKPGAPHHSSARDLAVLSRYALGLPHFRELVSTYEYTMRANTTGQPHLYSYNSMLDRVMGSGRRYGYPGLDGIKTGMTNEAGYCMSASAERNGLRLIAVVLGCPTADARKKDVTTLLDYGFRVYTSVNLAKEGETVYEVEVRRGNVDTVAVAPVRDLVVGVKRGEESTLRTWFEWNTEKLVAPLAAGTEVGYMVAGKQDIELARVPLVTQVPVEKGSMWQILLQSTKRALRTIIPGGK